MPTQLTFDQLLHAGSISIQFMQLDKHAQNAPANDLFEEICRDLLRRVRNDFCGLEAPKPKGK